MKKLLLIICLFFIGTQVFAQKADSTLTAKEVYKDIKDVLKSLGESLKVGTDHVYKVLVKQQIVKSIVWFIVLIIGFISVPISIKMSGNVKFDDYGKVEKGGIYIASSLLFGSLSLFCIMGGMLHIDTIVTGFVNPEYGAIDKIINLIKK